VILDVLGIGFGPSNIALAIALEESGFTGSRLFLERSARETEWQEELLLPGSDIQHHALRDLVTPVNPRSRFGFLSYLEAHGRLFDFLNLPRSYAFRSDYARYVRWVSEQLSQHVRHGSHVLRARANGGLYEVETADGETLRTRALVLGIGRSPNVPAELAHLPRELCSHSREYLTQVRRMEASGARPRRIAVVGASQSAVEITLDLRTRWPDAQVFAIQRGYGYQTKDRSPFTHHVYFPEFVDHFFGAPQAVKNDLWTELKRTNYAAADDDVVNELYSALYEDRLREKQRVFPMTNVAVRKAEAAPAGGVELTLRNRLDDREATLGVDHVILATGYRDLGVGGAREKLPAIAGDLAPSFDLTPEGTLAVNRDYSVRMRPGCPLLFLNGMCEATHGFGDAGSFSLVAIRAATIHATIERERRARAPRPIRELASCEPHHDRPSRGEIRL